MPRGRLAAEAGGEAFRKGWVSAISGRRTSACQPFADRFCDGFEIDFGFSRAGDAVEEDRVEPAADGGDQAVGGNLLIVAEVRRRKIGIGAGQRLVGVDLDPFQRAAVHQPAQHRVADLGMSGEFADRALAAFERGRAPACVAESGGRGAAGQAIFG